MNTNNQGVVDEHSDKHFTSLIVLYQQTLNYLKQMETTDFRLEQKCHEFLKTNETCLNEIHNLMMSENNPIYFAVLIQINNDLSHIKETIYIKLFGKTEEAGYCNSDITNILSEEKNMQSKCLKDNSDSDKKYQERLNIINKTIIKPNHGLKEIAGMKETKNMLIETVVYPIKYPHLFIGDRKIFNQLLLYGPPGTGKTLLAHGLASEINATFYNVSSADLLSSWLGESEKIIKLLFQQAICNHNQSVIFIDEVDSLCRHRTNHEEEHTRRIKTELLTQMEQITNKKIYLLCATNCPWDIDSAFLRRFKKSIYIPLPDRKSRLDILHLKTKSINFNISIEEFETLLNGTEGFSGSDLSNLVNSALYEPLKNLESTTHWILTSGHYQPCARNNPEAIQCSIQQLPSNMISVRDVNIQDFFNVLQHAKKTVSNTELQKYQVYNKSICVTHS